MELDIVNHLNFVSELQCYGNETQVQCAFPFKVLDHLHPKCTTAHYPPYTSDLVEKEIYNGPAWCSTKNDPEGKPISWEYCHHSCYGKGAKILYMDIINLKYF